MDYNGAVEMTEPGMLQKPFEPDGFSSLLHGAFWE